MGFASFSFFTILSFVQTSHLTGAGNKEEMRIHSRGWDDEEKGIAMAALRGLRQAKVKENEYFLSSRPSHVGSTLLSPSIEGQVAACV